MEILQLYFVLVSAFSSSGDMRKMINLNSLLSSLFYMQNVHL